MKAQTKWVSAAAVAAMTAVVVPFTLRAAATDTPAFEPDGNAKGSVAFFDSTGAQITGGANLSHLFDYAEASTAGRTGTTKATLFFALPDHTKPDSSTWFESQASATSGFPNSSAPVPVKTFTNPVATSGPTGANLQAVLDTSTLDSTQGYANIVQIRVKDSGPNLPSQPTPFWESDILVDQTAGTWQEISPVNPGGLEVTSALPHAPVAVAYKQKLAATGGTGALTWTVASGTLPPGLKLATSGTITGSPPTEGSYTFQVAVHDKTKPTPLSGGKTFTLVVDPMRINSADLPTGFILAKYGTKLTASGGKGAHHFSLVGGSLPPGLALAPSGAIGGTPTATGTFLFTAQVTDSNKPTARVATQSFLITINPMTITTASLPAGHVGTAFKAKLATSGGKGAKAYTVSSGSLPTGVKLSSSGVFSGTPTAAGSFTFTVQAADKSTPPLTATHSYTVVVS